MQTHDHGLGASVITLVKSTSQTGWFRTVLIFCLPFGAVLAPLYIGKRYADHGVRGLGRISPLLTDEEIVALHDHLRASGQDHECGMEMQVE